MLLSQITFTSLIDFNNVESVPTAPKTISIGLVWIKARPVAFVARLLTVERLWAFNGVREAGRQLEFVRHGDALNIPSSLRNPASA